MLKEQEKLLEKAKNQGFMPELVKIFEDDEEGLSRYNVAELKKLYKLMRFYIKDQADLAKRADMLIYVVEECEEMYIPDNFERTYAAMVYITECEKRYGSTYNMRWLVMQLAAMELTWDEIDLIVRRTVNTPGLGQSKWCIPDIVHDAKERGCGMDDICIYLDIYIKALDGDRCYFRNCSKFIDRIERYKTYGISHDNIILNEKLIKRGDYDEVCLRIIERTYPDIRNFVKGFKKAADNIEKAAGFKTLYHCNNALYCYDIDDVKSYVEFCRLREKMGKAYKCGTTAMTIYVPVTEVLYDMSLSGICLKFSFYDGLHLKKSSQGANGAGSDFYISPRETPQTVKEYLITADMNMYVKRNKKWIPLQLQELGVAFTDSPAIKEMFMFFINQFIKMKKNAWKDAWPSLDDYAVSGLPKLAANELTAAKIYEEQGILCNKQWLEENIKPILEEKMPELAENTFKYMHFSDPQYEKWVENADFTHLNEGPFPLKDYEKLYDDVSMFMQHGIDPTKDLNNVIMTSPGICVTNNTASEIKPFAFEDSDIGGLYITDNIEKIGIGAFNGCTGMSTVSMADELTAKTDAEIFSDTQIDTGAMKKVAETTKTAQFGKNMVQKTKTTEMEIGA